MFLDKKFYKNVLDNLYDGVYVVDKNRKILYWNKGAERITGYKKDEIMGSFCYDNILNHINDKGENLCENNCPLVKSIKNGKPLEESVYLRHKNGHRVSVSIRVTPIRNKDHKIIGAAEVFSDNSAFVESLQRIEELRKLALLDPLTKLGNRRYAEMNLNSKLTELRRYKNPFGFFFIDIDNFKEINDKYGHNTGDRVLKMVANSLRNSLRGSDIITRWGGEEFVAIISNVSKEELSSIADKLRVFVLKSNFEKKNNIIQVTISIGATLANQNDDVDKLIKRADELMYQSKKSGKNTISIG